MKKKIAVFFGGKSCEHDISVITALQAMSQIDRKTYEVFPVYIKDGFFVGGLDKISEFTPFCPENHKRVYLIDKTFFEFGRKPKKCFKPDAALLCTHGGDGENGNLQGMLEMADIPYTSADVAGSAVCMNKVLAKQLLENSLFNVVKYKVIKKDEYLRGREEAADAVEKVLGYPVIVKPSSLGSSIGIEVAKDRDGLFRAIDVAVCFDETVLVERELTDFTEINCAVLSDGETVTVSETECPVTWNSFLTYEDKYLSNGKMSGSARRIPAPVSDPINSEVKAAAEKVFRELGLKGVVRIDFLYDKSAGKLYVNEINTIPGSLAFYLFEPLGISYENMLTKLIEGAICAHDKKQSNTYVFKSQVLQNFGNGIKK